MPENRNIEPMTAAQQHWITMLARQQGTHNGFRQNCPRCGLPKIKPRLRTNALSRRADLHICDACGNEEALEDMDGSPKSLSGWAMYRPDYSVLPKDGPAEIALPSDLPCGTECWAWQYEWPRGMSMPSARILPARGILAHTNQEIGTEKQAPGWFVPYAKNTRKPAWTKCVRIECVNLHADKADAMAAFDAAVEAIAARFEDMAKLVRKDAARAPVHATAAVAGAVSGSGCYGWACVVITADTTSVVSGCGMDPRVDGYKAAMKALDTAAKCGAMQGATEIQIWPSEPGIAAGLGCISAENEPRLLPPDIIGDPDMDAKMRSFLDQAARMADEQLRHAEATMS